MSPVTPKPGLPPGDKLDELKPTDKLKAKDPIAIGEKKVDPADLTVTRKPDGTVLVKSKGDAAAILAKLAAKDSKKWTKASVDKALASVDQVIGGSMPAGYRRKPDPEGL